MACRYFLDGKEYDATGLRAALKALPPERMAKYVPRAAQALAAKRSAPEQFLKQVFREIPDVTDAQATDLLKIMQERPQDLGDALIAAMKPKTFDKFLEAWKAGLVSAPGTQVANVLGNIGEQLVRLGETATAPLVDRLIGGPATRLHGEARMEFGGAMRGVAKSLGRLSTDLSDIVRLAPERVDLAALEHSPKIGGKVGRGVRVPFRLLSAFDEFFKGIGGEAELHKLAFREAGGDLVKARELIANPTPEMLEAIKASKQARTFQEPNKLADAIVNLRSGHKWIHLVAPFVKTPSNIARAAWQRTPAGFYDGYKALHAYREALGKGGDVKEVARLKGEAVDKLARPLFGTAIMASFYAVAKAGGMTGSGPADPKDRYALQGGGWQPYSFVIPVAGGKHLYVPYSRFEPVSSLLGLVADANEAGDEKKAGDFLEKSLSSLVQNFTSKTYLQGIADAAAAVNDPQRSMSSVVSSFGGSVVPNVVSKVAQAIDPTIRETKGSSTGIIGIPERVARTIASRIPGASLALEAKKGAAGEDVQRPGNAVTRLLSPIQPSIEKDDADVRKALVDLDAVPPVPNREITVKGSKIRLNEEEYATLTKAANQAYSRTKAILRNPQFAKMGDEEQRNYIKDIFNRYERDARKRLYAIPSFRMRAVEARRAVLAQMKQRSA